MMRRPRQYWTALLVAVSIGLVAGCTSSPEKETNAGGPQAGSSSASSGDKAETAKTEKPESAGQEKPEVLLEPFDAPSLAELDAKAEWEDQPVLDGTVLLRAKQAGETPLATVQEALAMKNTSPESNAKILSAMGRLPATDADANWEATINRHMGADVKSTNPIMFSAAVEGDVNGLTGYGLFSFDWNMKPFAAKETVVSWQTSKDRLYDKVVLRDDCTWSDGKPITAQDVVFSFKTIMDPRVPIPAVRSGTDKLRWVEAYGDYTVVFFHKEALATNVWNINFPVIPKHIYEKTIEKDPTLQDSPENVQYENKPISGGPYVLTNRKRGQEIVVERREDWYMVKGKQVRDKPFFKTIRFRIIEDSNTALLAIKAGEIDEMMLTPEQWTTRTDSQDFYDRNTKGSGVEWVFAYFAWNQQDNPFFADIRVRKAMSYAFDYQEMLDKLFYGVYQPCNGIFYPTAWMAPKKPLPYYHQDLSKAEALLDEAGWEDHDGDGIRDKTIDGKSVNFEFSLLCANIPDRIKLCTLMKENLDKIGIVCNIRPLEFTVLMERTQKKKFEAFHGLWGTGTDPDTSDNIWYTGEARNYVHYSNSEVDKLYVEGRKEFDRDKRAAIYAKIDELIYADQPYTFLYVRNSFYGFDKNLRGYNFSPRGPFHYSPGFSSIWQAAP